MKIGERLFDDDGRVIHRTTYDPNPALEKARVLRGRGGDQFGSDSKMIGIVPATMVTQWLREAGVRWDDPAAEDVINRKLQSGEYSKLRVWEGKY